MGFLMHVYFLFLLGKLQVLQQHPVIKHVKCRRRDRGMKEKCACVCGVVNYDEVLGNMGD